jgi:hypothetical protein
LLYGGKLRVVFHVGTSLEQLTGGHLR